MGTATATGRRVTYLAATLVGSLIVRLGDTFHLPDGPSGDIIAIDSGTEFGDPVWYITVRTHDGYEATRWVRRLEAS